MQRPEAGAGLDFGEQPGGRSQGRGDREIVEVMGKRGRWEGQ